MSLHAFDPAPTINSASLVTSWLWIGVACLLLLDVRARLSATYGELVLQWAFEDLWTRPVLAGLSNERVLLLLNPLFAVLLWVASRAPTPRDRRARGTLALRRLAHLGTATVLLALQWAIASVADGLPSWVVTQIR